MKNFSALPKVQEFPTKLMLDVFMKLSKHFIWHNYNLKNCIYMRMCFFIQAQQGPIVKFARRVQINLNGSNVLGIRYIPYSGFRGVYILQISRNEKFREVAMLGTWVWFF